jgi:hypothetical protein
MLINDAMFRNNGNTGFVLKPDFLQYIPANNQPFDLKNDSTWPKRLQKNKIYKITVSLVTQYN